MTAVLDEMLANGQMQAPPEPRRVHGLRFPVLPTGGLIAQIGGALATLGGVYMLAGTAVALIVGGASSVVLGALREAGKV